MEIICVCFCSYYQEENTSLETLNIGMNNLTDEFLRTIKEPLILNKNLLRLGLQSTMLTNESALILADVLKNNELIQVRGVCGGGTRVSSELYYKCGVYSRRFNFNDP